jgi:hypothetical protein
MEAKKENRKISGGDAYVISRKDYEQIAARIKLLVDAQQLSYMLYLLKVRQICEKIEKEPIGKNYAKNCQKHFEEWVRVRETFVICRQERAAEIEDLRNKILEM